MNLKWILLLIPVIMITSFSSYKVKTITGTVQDDWTNNPLADVIVKAKGTNISVKTDQSGKFQIEVPERTNILQFEKFGYQTQKVKIGKRAVIEVKLLSELPDDEVVEEMEMVSDNFAFMVSPRAVSKDKKSSAARFRSVAPMANSYIAYPETDTEEYATVKESGFLTPGKSPYSTFSIDVDAAGYSNVRRFLNNGQMPPVDAVRVEEMINYFNYDYKGPGNKKQPFAIYSEVAPAPWNPKHQLVHIGLQGKRIEKENLPPSNLVFLIDVSGSMSAPNKLPLLQSAFRLLVEQLRPSDKVSIVVYAGAAGLVLEPTKGDQKDKILKSLDQLEAGGSTAGGAGIELAYKKAKENFIPNGNNRVILATDGDFNVGKSSNEAMEHLIERKRKEGVYLTVLGFGMGNYKDAKMEILADKGNGNYAYIDNILEAKKVLVNEFGGTLFTIAKDVKIQVEFNPENVQAYRLIGYENRKLADEDFNNDLKDAGELGSGHSVTALYEIVPTGVESSYGSVDPLKYQKASPVKSSSQHANELMTVKLRYKDPKGSQEGTPEKSKLISQVVKKPGKPNINPTENFQWSAAVAAYGMVLRDSPYKGKIKHEDIISMAQSARGKDEEGYRIEFIQLVRSSAVLAKSE